jgi:protein O-GlcNAc transferase
VLSGCFNHRFSTFGAKLVILSKKKSRSDQMASIRKLKRTMGHQKKQASGSSLPSQPQALRQAIILYRAGRLPEAETLFRQVIMVEPTHHVALHFLGLLAYRAGHAESAVMLIEKALNFRPDYIDAQNDLGSIFSAQGKLEEAATSYGLAVALEPGHVQAHYNFALVLQKLGRLEEAVASYGLAISLAPSLAAAHNNLGVTLAELGRLEEAVTSYRRALALQPTDAEAHNNLGTVLTALGRDDEGIASFRRAITIAPGHADACYNLGNAFRAKGNLGEAVASYKRAIDCQDDHVDAHYNLGIVLQAQGRIDEAITSYRRALALQPGHADAHSNLLLCLNYLPGVTQKEIFAESIRWNKQHAEGFLRPPPDVSGGEATERKLKIAYLSADFRDHSVAYFIEPVLKAHNRNLVQVYCYANVRRPDATTSRLQAAADCWCSISGMSDNDAVERIRKDGIDILVDLGGHSGDKRLLVLAGKPAPVQVTWLGYPNTTGVDGVAYRLTDVIADPRGEADGLHSEKLIRLGHGFLCYQPESSAPHPGALPCLERGYVTFGSFNNLAKLNHEVVKAWAEILHRQPRSRLLLKSNHLEDPDTSNRFLGLFAENGIAAERLELHGWLPGKRNHLELYRSVDIGLDPFPYNGTTTTCEALWMGVPVVTMSGDRHAARVGASIMHHVGLEELVASELNEYIAMAVSLAEDRQRLRALRENLRQKMLESQLMNRDLFTATLEEAYRSMWRKWCVEGQNKVSSVL